MEQDKIDLEEGEIEDDDDGVNAYTPLERPKTYALDAPHKRFPEVGTNYSDDEDELQSSETDSDSDAGCQQNKKPKKVKIAPKPLQRMKQHLKKYDIWSTRAQEDVLAETMISCDVTLKDRSRDVESYDFSIARKYYDELENQQGTKRTRDNMKNFNFMPKRSHSQMKEFKGKPREIPELSVDSSSSEENVAKDVASKLNEEREDLILRVVEVMGKEKCIELFNETKDIESQGGMPILNQTRRRTPGGVFLYLVRNDYHITREQREKIFIEEKQRYNKMRKEQRKKKMKDIRMNANLERNNILPELLTRAELLAKENPIHTLKETDEANCTNPPPSPETDHHESGDGMEPAPTVGTQSVPVELIVLNDSLNKELNNIRGKLKTYDEDFLDISCDDMDLF